MILLCRTSHDQFAAEFPGSLFGRINKLTFVHKITKHTTNRVVLVFIHRTCVPLQLVPDRLDKFHNWRKFYLLICMPLERTWEQFKYYTLIIVPSPSSCVNVEHISFFTWIDSVSMKERYDTRGWMTWSGHNRPLLIRFGRLTLSQQEHSIPESAFISLTKTTIKLTSQGNNALDKPAHCTFPLLLYLTSCHILCPARRFGVVQKDALKGGIRRTGWNEVSLNRIREG